MRARTALRLPAMRTIDGLLGAVLTGCVGLGIAWIIGAVALDCRRIAAAAPRHSALGDPLRAQPAAAALGPVLHALARFDPLPSVRGPAADVPRPTRGILATAGVRRAAPSVVRVVGHRVRARGRGQRVGCGAGHGRHQRPRGRGRDRHDRAGRRAPPALSVPQWSTSTRTTTSRSSGSPACPQRPLSLAPIRGSGTSAAILGYPLDGGFDARAGPDRPDRDRQHRGRVRATDRCTRAIVSLRGLVRPGNSGGPMVDSAGQVVATVFAAITGSTGSDRGPGRLRRPNSLVRAAARRRADWARTPGSVGAAARCGG